MLFFPKEWFKHQLLVRRKESMAVSSHFFHHKLLVLGCFDPTCCWLSPRSPVTPSQALIWNFCCRNNNVKSDCEGSSVLGLSRWKWLKLLNCNLLTSRKKDKESMMNSPWNFELGIYCFLASYFWFMIPKIYEFFKLEKAGISICYELWLC